MSYPALPRSINQSVDMNLNHDHSRIMEIVRAKKSKEKKRKKSDKDEQWTSSSKPKKSKKSSRETYDTPTSSINSIQPSYHMPSHLPASSLGTFRSPHSLSSIPLQQSSYRSDVSSYSSPPQLSSSISHIQSKPSDEHHASFVSSPTHESARYTIDLATDNTNPSNDHSPVQLSNIPLLEQIAAAVQSANDAHVSQQDLSSQSPTAHLPQLDSDTTHLPHLDNETVPLELDNDNPDSTGSELVQLDKDECDTYRSLYDLIMSKPLDDLTVDFFGKQKGNALQIFGRVNVGRKLARNNLAKRAIARNIIHSLKITPPVHPDSIFIIHSSQSRKKDPDFVSSRAYRQPKAIDNTDQVVNTPARTFSRDDLRRYKKCYALLTACPPLSDAVLCDRTKKKMLHIIARANNIRNTHVSMSKSAIISIILTHHANHPLIDPSAVPVHDDSSHFISDSDEEQHVSDDSDDEDLQLINPVNDRNSVALYGWLITKLSGLDSSREALKINFTLFELALIAKMNGRTDVNLLSIETKEHLVTIVEEILARGPLVTFNGPNPLLADKSVLDSLQQSRTSTPRIKPSPTEVELNVEITALELDRYCTLHTVLSAMPQSDLTERTLSTNVDVKDVDLIGRIHNIISIRPSVAKSEKMHSLYDFLRSHQLIDPARLVDSEGKLRIAPAHASSYEAAYNVLANAPAESLNKDFIAANMKRAQMAVIATYNNITRMTTNLSKKRAATEILEYLKTNSLVKPADLDVARPISRQIPSIASPVNSVTPPSITDAVVPAVEAVVPTTSIERAPPSIKDMQIQEPKQPMILVKPYHHIPTAQRGLSTSQQVNNRSVSQSTVPRQPFDNQPIIPQISQQSVNHHINNHLGHGSYSQQIRADQVINHLMHVSSDVTVSQPLPIHQMVETMNHFISTEETKPVQTNENAFSALFELADVAHSAVLAPVAQAAHIQPRAQPFANQRR